MLMIDTCLNASMAGFEGMYVRRQLIGFLGPTRIASYSCCALVLVGWEST